ncbi:hypothetical protein GCM10010201_09380 [Pilimelia columellifera subsp. columellifera]|uniref:Uncharacterized protein n=2 Tax=Pilimelia TaxID=53370 RepID=A0ABP6AEK8_9ACTN
MHLRSQPLVASTRTVAAAVTGILVITAGTAAVAQAADANIRIVGGNGAAEVVCGNVAVAQQLANKRRIPMQANRCTANSAGGSVELANVEIYVKAAARAANQGNRVLAALDAAAAGTANDQCARYRASNQQSNRCLAEGHSGNTNLSGVTHVYRDAQGSVKRRTLDDLVLGASSLPAPTAACRNVVTDAVNQQDDCVSTGGAPSWSLTGVDARVGGALRQNINIEIRGGSARSYIYCFNYTDGTGKVRQLNVCDARARAGDITLRNVVIHTES